MRKINKTKTTALLVVIMVLIILVFLPKPVYIEFGEPKQPNELIEMFQNVSIKTIEFHAVGANHSAGGIAENLDDIEPILSDLEIETGEKFIGIKSILCSISGTDLIYLMTHKQEFDVNSIYSFQIVMGKIEDAIEKMVFR